MSISVTVNQSVFSYFFWRVTSKLLHFSIRTNSLGRNCHKNARMIPDEPIDCQLKGVAKFLFEYYGMESNTSLSDLHFITSSINHLAYEHKRVIIIIAAAIAMMIGVVPWTKLVDMITGDIFASFFFRPCSFVSQYMYNEITTNS